MIAQLVVDASLGAAQGGALPLGIVAPSLALAKQTLLVGIHDLEPPAELEARVERWSRAVKEKRGRGGADGRRYSADHSISLWRPAAKSAAKRAAGGGGTGEGSGRQRGSAGAGEAPKRQNLSCHR